MPRGKRSRGRAISNARNIEKCFNAWNNGEPNAPVVHDKDRRVVHKREGEIFLRCTDPYPKEYYISNHGRLISFSAPRNPKLRTKKPYWDEETASHRYGYQYTVYKNGRPCYTQKKKKKYAVKDTAQTIKIVLDTWQAHGYYLENAYGFAKNENDHPEIKFYSHHELGIDTADTIEADAKNHNPENIGRLSKYAHYDVVGYAQQHPRSERSEAKEKTLVRRLNKLVENENPDRVTILIDDDEKVGLRDIQPEDVNKFLSPEGKILLMLGKKAHMTNHYFYYYCKELERLIYPVVLRDTKTGKVCIASVCTYDREQFERDKNTGKDGFSRPVFTAIESKEQLHEMIRTTEAFMNAVEMNMSLIPYYAEALTDTINVSISTQQPND